MWLGCPLVFVVGMEVVVVVVVLTGPPDFEGTLQGSGTPLSTLS